MADPFFQEEQQEEQQEVEKIKVGEREFTQEELNKRIGLSDVALEAEEKYNRPISKFWPEYTKSQQENEKLRQELEEARKPKETITPTDQEQVTLQAREELKKLGYIPAEEVEQRARNIASEVVSGYRLLDQVSQVVSKNSADGNPQVSSEELLEYMQENNLANPELAYKVKFEKELDQIKEKKLASIKPQGMVTVNQSTAGSKLPQPMKITKDNLQDVLGGYLRGGGGQ